MALSDELVQRLIEIIQQVRQTMSEVQAFVDTMLANLDAFWDWLADAIRAGMDALAAKAREFFDKVEDVLSKPGSATALEEAGRRWHEEVARPAHQLAGDLNLDRLAVDDYWTGLAGSAYRTTVPTHSGAFNDIRIAADGIQNSLTSMANEVRNFLTASIAAAGIALGGVLTLAAAIIVPPTAPAAFTVASIVFGTALALLTTAIAALISFMNGARSQQTALHQSLDRITAWPAANQQLTPQENWKVNEDI